MLWWSRNDFSNYYEWSSSRLMSILPLIEDEEDNGYDVDKNLVEWVVDLWTWMEQRSSNTELRFSGSRQRQRHPVRKCRSCADFVRGRRRKWWSGISFSFFFPQWIEVLINKSSADTSHVQAAMQAHILRFQPAMHQDCNGKISHRSQFQIAIYYLKYIAFWNYDLAMVLQEILSKVWFFKNLFTPLQYLLIFLFIFSPKTLLNSIIIFYLHPRVKSLDHCILELFYKSTSRRKMIPCFGILSLKLALHRKHHEFQLEIWTFVRSLSSQASLQIDEDLGIFQTNQILEAHCKLGHFSQIPSLALFDVKCAREVDSHSKISRSCKTSLDAIAKSPEPVLPMSQRQCHLPPKDPFSTLQLPWRSFLVI